MNPVVGAVVAIGSVNAIAALIAAIGLGLLAVGFWLIRATRPDPELLAPLEVMGTRWWRKGDPVWQRRTLDDFRPDEAEPLHVMAAPPKIDVDFDAGPKAPGFDDIIEPVDGDEVAAEAQSEPVDEALLEQAPVPPSDDSTSPVDRGHTGETLSLDGFGETDIDPDVLAAAERELMSELGIDPTKSPRDGG